ncbi:MAG: GNAT family N-acetyltransferase [Clostridia bacterium]|nr:GNAT family N-acetyltransferase [Clostridia bacterium]
MIIELARGKDKRKIEKLDCHLPSSRLGECIANGRIYVLKDDSVQNGGANHRLKDPVVGVLRYGLFWHTIPFLELLYIEKAYRNRGFGTEMMRKWEETMLVMGYKYVLTSTQSDEDAWRFYEKLGYQRIGGFFPPEQEAKEWIYGKKTGNQK